MILPAYKQAVAPICSTVVGVDIVLLNKNKALAICVLYEIEPKGGEKNTTVTK